MVPFMTIPNPIADNRYSALPDGFLTLAAPSPPPAPTLAALNLSLLGQYGLMPDWFASDDGVAILSGQRANPDNPPIAMAYSGHQFGGWSPLLGDGRAHMLGQMRVGDGTLVDVQLKGSGRTAYSRSGDGKATLSSALREYLVSEAMAGLGIPATRALAVIATGETIRRDRPEPGGILVRTATSHIRVGSFQHAAANIDEDAVRALADFMLAYHFPHAAQAPEPYRALFDEVVARQAQLIAQWMLVGFIHGVMNTDNMSIIGETIDFGPCAFIDEFKPDKVFSSIDAGGRYAWNRQPAMAHWNLTRLAEAMLPLFSADEAQSLDIANQSLGRFADLFDQAFWPGFAAKMGVKGTLEEVRPLADDLMRLMTQDGTDFTVTFDGLTRYAQDATDISFAGLFADADGIAAWLHRWQAMRALGKIDDQVMRRANPVLIARNHQVERALTAATHDGDFSLFHRLATALANPWSVAPDNADLLVPPLPEQRVCATFCGT
jgi:uncharacterized protein YdiU (UPF0061 family)